MPESETKRPITIVSAVMNANGCPDFALNVVEVTQEQIDNGIHYYLTEAQLIEDGYEEPYVHFDQFESPAFLHPAVLQHLGLAPVIDVATPCACPPREEHPCPV